MGVATARPYPMVLVGGLVAPPSGPQWGHQQEAPPASGPMIPQPPGMYQLSPLPNAGPAVRPVPTTVAEQPTVVEQPPLPPPEGPPSQSRQLEIHRLAHAGAQDGTWWFQLMDTFLAVKQREIQYVSKATKTYARLKGDPSGAHGTRRASPSTSRMTTAAAPLCAQHAQEG